jgi:hypothetical protein
MLEFVLFPREARNVGDNKSPPVRRHERKKNRNVLIVLEARSLIPRDQWVFFP